MKKNKNNKKPKPIKLDIAWECDWCGEIYKTKIKAFDCCEDFQKMKTIYKDDSILDIPDKCPDCEYDIIDCACEEKNNN